MAEEKPLTYKEYLKRQMILGLKASLLGEHTALKEGADLKKWQREQERKLKAEKRLTYKNLMWWELTQGTIRDLKVALGLKSASEAKQETQDYLKRFSEQRRKEREQKLQEKEQKKQKLQERGKKAV